MLPQQLDLLNDTAAKATQQAIFAQIEAYLATNPEAFQQAVLQVVGNGTGGNTGGGTTGGGTTPGGSTPTSDPVNTAGVGALAIHYTAPAAGYVSMQIRNSDKVVVNNFLKAEPVAQGEGVFYWPKTDDFAALVPDGLYYPEAIFIPLAADGGPQSLFMGHVGNNSTYSSGEHNYHAGQLITGMCFAGQFGYAVNNYPENVYGWHKFDISNPTVKINLHSQDSMACAYVCTDGQRVYYLGSIGFDQQVAAWDISAGQDYTFANGSQAHAGNTYYNVVGTLDGGYTPAGMAVQQSGNYLFCVYRNGYIQVLDKVSGARLSLTQPTTQYQGIALQSDSLAWVLDGTTLRQMSVGSNGVLTATGLAITSVANPFNLAVPPDGSRVSTLDRTAYRPRHFRTSDGTEIANSFPATNFANDATVTDYTLYLDNTKSFVDNDYGQAHPFIAYQLDGSFWIGDTGNYRCQHYDANGNYLNQIAYIGFFYSGSVDANDVSSWWANYLNYKVTYNTDKSIATQRLVRNYSAQIQASRDDQFVRLVGVATIPYDGLTYAMSQERLSQSPFLQTVLTELGPTKLTYRTTFPGRVALNADGSVTSVNGDASLGSTVGYYRQTITGKVNGSLTYSDQVLTRQLTSITRSMPVTSEGGASPNQTTASGDVVIFSSDNGQARGDGYHLGLLAAGSTVPAWQTSLSTIRAYRGPMPTDGSADIGNDVLNPFGNAHAIGDYIIWNYKGENWKGGQGLWFYVYTASGLFVTSFGVAPPTGLGESPAGFEGNVIDFSLAPFGDDVAIGHNGEFIGGGLTYRLLKGLQTVVPLALSTAGANMPAIPGTNLLDGFAYDVDITDNYGWSNTSTPGLVIHTGLATTDRQQPSWSFLWNPGSNGGSANPSRVLPTQLVTTQWGLSCYFNFVYQAFDQSNDTAGMQVLDNNGLVILDFRRKQTGFNGDNPQLSPGPLLVNGQNGGGPQTYLDWSQLGDALPKFLLVATSAGIAVSFGPYPTFTVGYTDSGANWLKPTTLQFAFHSTGDHQAGMNVSGSRAAPGLRFLAA